MNLERILIAALLSTLVQSDAHFLSPFSLKCRALLRFRDLEKRESNPFPANASAREPLWTAVVRRYPQAVLAGTIKRDPPPSTLAIRYQYVDNWRKPRGVIEY